MTVAFLHPGMMGASLADACAERAVWASAGRSPTTAARAADLDDLVTVAAAVDAAEVVVSICPPAAAESVAEQVASLGFGGIYVDANAISPATARRIATRFDRFVDGSVVGPPAREPGTTRLYLSGDEAADVADLWRGSVLDARTLDGGIGAASALKMAYATCTKAAAAMQLGVLGLARAEGVEGALVDEWRLSQPGLVDRGERVAAGVAPKAWRFVGEMEQIAAAFDAAGLPSGFAAAAADIYRRLAEFKDSEAPSLDEVIARLS